MDDTNFITDDFDGFGVEDDGSDLPQWDTWDPAFGNKKTTPTETKNGKMTKDPHPGVDDIRSFNN